TGARTRNDKPCAGELMGLRISAVMRRRTLDLSPTPRAEAAIMGGGLFRASECRHALQHPEACNAADGVRVEAMNHVGGDASQSTAPAVLPRYADQIVVVARARRYSLAG